MSEPVRRRFERPLRFLQARLSPESYLGLHLTIGAAVIIALIGISRIYLGAHYFTDVIGAIAVGLAWLAFCWTGVETLRRWRGRSFSRAAQDASS